ncbi:signal peptidase I [Eubacterium ruminantium]|jgi:signal peptidase I|uniref:Signal peptidase I n=1 Tax=Eubacterium ruminantium TaxID=42322 RepID=A0A1T4LXX2_9FIRM|nr:signal peptidase I [Eubacterium ruminantium]SCW38608.1 signal peptidase I [Eubacterium ruminantium]SDM44041.1 signal peptidase I [Eubacterium ruminantium]SJZ59517.1 signal peptidase I [Eubacterium ruminantium]
MDDLKRRKQKNIVDFSLVKSEKKIKGKKKPLKKLEFYIILIASALVFGFAFVTFMYQTVTMKGPSMQGTIEDEDVVVVSKMRKFIKGVHVNDVIAVKRSKDTYYSIKRVVAKPGDSVQIIGGKLYVNDELQEKFKDQIIVNPGNASNKIVLEKNQFYVLGDNVNNSDDSRFPAVGIVQKTDITGIVIYKLSPKEHKGKVK